MSSLQPPCGPARLGSILWETLVFLTFPCNLSSLVERLYWEPQLKHPELSFSKRKKKKTRLTSIVFDFSATWHCGHMKPPEKRPSLSTEHLPRLLGSLIFNKEAECTVLSPPCCSCPRREVSGSFIPNIWGNTFWYTVTRMSLHFRKERSKVV